MLEYLAASRAVVTQRLHHTLPETLDGVVGWFDSPATCLAHCRQLLDDEQACEALQRRARDDGTGSCGRTRWCFAGSTRSSRRLHSAVGSGPSGGTGADEARKVTLCRWEYRKRARPDASVQASQLAVLAVWLRPYRMSPASTKSSGRGETPAALLRPVDDRRHLLDVEVDQEVIDHVHHVLINEMIDDVAFSALAVELEPHFVARAEVRSNPVCRVDEPTLLDDFATEPSPPRCSPRFLRDRACHGRLTWSTTRRERPQPRIGELAEHLDTVAAGSNVQTRSKRHRGSNTAATSRREPPRRGRHGVTREHSARPCGATAAGRSSRASSSAGRVGRRARGRDRLVDPRRARPSSRPGCSSSSTGPRGRSRPPTWACPVPSPSSCPGSSW